MILVRSRAFAVAAIAACALYAARADAQSPSVQRGLNFALANCARCHSVDKLTPSPLAVAPPFRDLHKRYPVENLQEAFAEGITTGHSNMPEFRLALDQIRDMIAFLKSLEQ